MKNLMLFLFSILFLILISSLNADELSNLKEELGALKKHSNSQSQTVDLLEKRIQQLEQSQQKDHDLVANLDNWKTYQEEDMAFLFDELGRVKKNMEKMVDWHIYGNIDFEDFHREDNRFDAESIEFIFNASLTPRLKFGGELEFERAAAIGGERGGELEFEQAYVDYAINEFFNIRAGIVMIPFGMYNIKHFAPFRDLSDTPLVNRRIIPTDWVDPGFGFFGNIPLTDRLTLGYETYFINGFSDDITDNGLRSAGQGFGSDNNNNKAVVGRLGLNPLHGLELGLSGYYGEYDDDDNDIRGFAVDWSWVYGNFELIGEYSHFGVESGLNEDGISVPDDLGGIYVQVNYHFWPGLLNHTFLKRQFPSPTFTGAFRYGSVEIDDDGDSDLGDNRERRYTFGLNYRPVETFVMKFEYQINQTKNETLVHGDNNGFVFSIAFAF